MKNYYDILGLSSYEDSQDVILSKYKEVTAKLRSQALDKDVTKKLIDVNEAYLVLSDAKLKQKYDYAFSNNSESDELKQYIAEKHNKASEFISGRLANTPKKRKKSKWPAIICGILILSAIGIIIRACTHTNAREYDSNIKEVSSIITPEDWTEYNVALSFKISIPKSLKQSGDEFNDEPQWISDDLCLARYSALFFEQEDLDKMSSKQDKSPTLIIIRHFSFSPGEVNHHYESPYLTYEDYKTLKEMTEQEIRPYTFIQHPLWDWIDVDGMRILEGPFTYEGYGGNIDGKIYLIYNFDEFAEIIISYSHEDKKMWEEEFDKIIRTFRWNNPK